MALEALAECEGKERWHRVLSIDFEPGKGRIFVSISHSPDECGFPLICKSSRLITLVKGFREKNL